MSEETEVVVTKFGSKDALAVLLSLLTIGTTFAIDHKSTVMAVGVLLVTWFSNEVCKRTGAPLGKRWLTMIVFGLSMVLAMVFQPFSIPLFPTWAGDASAFSSALVNWITAVVAVASGIVAYATTLYNVLMAQVLERLGEAVATALAL